MPSFYDGKRFFLTFPTLDRTPQELVAFLQNQAPVRYYVVARELHEDGQPHLHACVEFADHQRRPVNWLDSFGIHPNKQDPRKWKACIAYTKKGGDYLSGPDQAESSERSLQEVIAATTSQEDWMEYCVSKKVSFQYAMWFWNRFKGDLHTLVDNECGGRMCVPLESLVYTPDHRKAWILKGPSGCGKTTWAKRAIPKPALFCRHIDSLKNFRPGYHVSIIFDDVDFNHYPRTSQIHLVDWDNPSDIHCRHSCAYIPQHVHKIFTCNEWPVCVADPAIKRRVRCINIY